MKSFCELIAEEILPGARALMAKELIGAYGLTQSQVALKLGLSQPAISQYKKELRGHRVRILKSYPELLEFISNLARRVAEGSLTPAQLNSEFCEICKELKSKGFEQI